MRSPLHRFTFVAFDAQRLLTLWQRFARFPGGRLAFTLALRFVVPYSGTVAPRILELSPGHARVAMRDRRRVRNHLKSVHAIALANLGELTSGLAMTVALPASVRAILVGLEVAYLKKARGVLVADCRCAVPEVLGDVEHAVVSGITDAAGDVVARVTARWRLGQVPPR